MSTLLVSQSRFSLAVANSSIMGALDLAGVIGTWVAAGLAVIALVGVVGPVLVWKASQSNRNLGLDRLDEGLATSGGYISKGVQFWSGKRLFRRIQAPILSSPPQLSGWKPSWKSGSPIPSRKSAMWVQLGAVLQAYGLPHSPINTCPHDQKERLESSLSLLLCLMEDKSYNRRVAISIYELDQLLITISKQDRQVRQFLQVVTITSPEIRDVVRQSVRNLTSCMDTTITFDAQTATVNVGTYLGLVKKFPVDIDVLVEGPSTYNRSGKVEIPYAEVLLMVLDACVKSLFFATSVDSAPLCQEVMGSSEVLRVAFSDRDAVVG